MRFALAVGLRLLVLVAAAELTFLVATSRYEPVGADIGSGLLAFLAAAILSFAWAALDARRSGKVGSTWLVWLPVAALAGIAATFRAQGYSPTLDTDVLAHDLVTLAPFHFGLIAIPSLFGAVVGTAFRPRR